MTSAQAPTVPHETELKFSLAPADFSAFKALACLADALITRSQLSALYFDTEDLALHHAGYSLRLRRDGDRETQTLKGPSLRSSGLFMRPEAEIEVTGGVLDEAALKSALPPDLGAACIGRLGSCLSVTFERTEWLVRRPDGIIVVSADSGWIEAGGKREPLAEVEFELREGSVAAVFALAREAVATVPLHVQLLAKSDRGYRLLGVQPNAPAGHAALGADLSAGDGFRILAGALLRPVLSERELVLGADAVEPVHRLRVALRRLRSLIEFAGETIADRRLERTRTIWRRAFRRLGEVRDLDILASAIPLNAVEADAAMGRVASERRRALDRARRALGSRRFAAAVLDLLAFAEDVLIAEDVAAANDIPADKRAARYRGASLQRAASRILGRRWRRLERAARPARLNPAARHRLRINAKTFRYALDFFGELYVTDKALRRRQKIDGAIRALQDVLGRLNDRASVERLARAHLGGTVAASLGLLPAGRLQAEELRGANKAHRRLLSRKAFWRRPTGDPDH